MSKGLPYRSDILVPSQRLFAIRHNAPATMLLPSWIPGWHFKNITVTGHRQGPDHRLQKQGRFAPAVFSQGYCAAGRLGLCIDPTRTSREDRYPFLRQLHRQMLCNWAFITLFHFNFLLQHTK